MRWDLPTLRLLLRNLAALTVVLVSSLYLQAGNDLEQHLRDQLKGKTLLLRGFYAGSDLRYDTSGQVSGPAVSGDWTVDGVVQVEDVKVSNNRLTIRARRLHMGWDHDTGLSDVADYKDKKSKKEDTRSLHIEAELNPGQETADSAEALLSRVFLSPQDQFAELVPHYWKPCVLAGLSGTNSRQYANCRFSPQFLAIPGVASTPEQPRELADAAHASGQIFHAGSGIAPPKVKYNPSPAFSEEARAARYQGTLVLAVVVDKTGTVRDIHVTSPLGMGLDRKAVENVSSWKFNPATKDGEPVEAEISVETAFHLY